MGQRRKLGLSSRPLRTDRAQSGYPFDLVATLIIERINFGIPGILELHS
jgi:hypothetical protein